MNPGDIGNPCVQCRNKTLLRCSNCSDPLCNECMNPKEPISIPFYESSIPAGLCKKCMTNHIIPKIYKETENKLKSFTEFLTKLFE